LEVGKSEAGNIQKYAGPYGPPAQGRAIRGGNRMQVETTGHKPGYFPIMDAAKYASVSPKTIQRWIKGGLPVFQGTTRGKVLIRPADIDIYLTRRQVRQFDLDAMVNEVLNSVQGSKLAA
jgi:hypothetical protein